MSDEERWIIIPRWDEFQHRDMARSSIPPWIKNLTRLASDSDYLALSLTQRGMLHGMWLLYATHRRELNEALARRYLVTNKAEARHWRRNLESLNHAGFVVIVASKPASRYASNLASLEVEVEVEQDQKPANATAVARPPAHANGDLEPDPDEPGPSPTSAIELARRLAGRITPAEDHLL